MVSYSVLKSSLTLMLPLHVLKPVAMEVAVEAESGAKEVLSYVCAEPAIGKSIMVKWFALCRTVFCSPSTLTVLAEASLPEALR